MRHSLPVGRVERLRGGYSSGAQGLSRSPAGHALAYARLVACNAKRRLVVSFTMADRAQQPDRPANPPMAEGRAP